MARRYDGGLHARSIRASNRAYNRARAEGIARGAREREQEERERIERVTAMRERERAPKEARRQRADLERRRRAGELTVEERIGEAQATIRESQAVELQAKAARIEEEQNWVSEFTPQQRHEISAFETAKGRVRADIGVGLNEVTGIRMIQELDRKIGSYQKIRRPRTKADGPIYPEGQGTGMTWPDPNGSGALLGRKPDGTQFTAVKPADTLQGMQLKEQMAMAEVQRRRMVKWEDEREKFTRDLIKEKIIIPGEEKWGPDAPPIERYRTPEEVQSELARVFGGAPSWAQAEVQQQREPIQAEPDEILHAREVIKAPGMGLRNVEEAEKRIEAWERRDHPMTEAQASRLPSGTEYQRQDGSWWRVP